MKSLALCLSLVLVPVVQLVAADASIRWLVAYNVGSLPHEQGWVAIGEPGRLLYVHDAPNLRALFVDVERIEP